MKYCKNCHVHFDTTIEHCILCNNELEQIEGTESTFKFAIYEKKPSIAFAYRLFLLLNLLSAGISLYYDYASGLPLSWSLVVAISNVYAIILFYILYIPTLWTSKLNKSVFITLIALVFIGLAIRSHAWALDYVFPIGITANIFLLTALLLAKKKRWYDYAISLFGVSLVGLLPGLLNLLKLTSDPLPSAICFIYSIATLIGMFFLSSKSSKEEFKRRFHI
ncbi:MAG: hypothetical protein IH571_05645 [Acholeplasmataceae bacterium]|nr:hypothetical protein [Acholeplasmataceae bacterium]